MAVRLHTLMTIGAAALMTAGCSVWPFGDEQARYAQPEPLLAAPSGSVTAEPLPPPGGMQPGSDVGGAPAASGGLASLGPSAQPEPAPAAAGAVQLGRTDLLGGWTITAAGDSCQLFMTLTTWAGGYRASTRGCSNASLQGISAWNMEGGQVQLLNDAGTTVARLYPSSRTQFNGQSPGGGPVTVSR